MYLTLRRCAVTLLLCLLIIGAAYVYFENDFIQEIATSQPISDLLEVLWNDEYSEIASGSIDSQSIPENCSLPDNSSSWSIPTHPSYKWYPVIKNSSDVFMFSAYLDPRKGMNRIQVLTISPNKKTSRKFFCQLRDGKGCLLATAKASRYIVPETHGRHYAPTIYTCQIDHLASTDNLAVSLTVSANESALHYLPLIVLDASQRPKHQFTVCTSPLHFGDDGAIYHFVETIEMSRILGADRFVIYNYTAAAKLSAYIRHYVDQGLVDVIPWNMPISPFAQRENKVPPIHYFGQVLALNDCIYRYMFRTKYLVLSDLDELIMPKGNIATWEEMMANLTANNERGAFLFRNSFFNLKWDDDTVVNHTVDKALHLMTQTKLWREKKMWAYRLRSKMILIPTDVYRTGIHFIFQYLDSGARQHNVPPSIGLLHHYRWWSGTRKPDNSIRDTTMLNYTTEIRERVERVHKTLGFVM